MTDSRESAYPLMPPLTVEGYSANGYPWPQEGLTKREKFALHALQGLLANSRPSAQNNEAAREAVMYADALIAELNKEKTDETTILQRNGT